MALICSKFTVEQCTMWLLNLVAAASVATATKATTTLAWRRPGCVCINPTLAKFIAEAISGLEVPGLLEIDPFIQLRLGTWRIGSSSVATTPVATATEPATTLAAILLDASGSSHVLGAVLALAIVEHLVEFAAISLLERVSFPDTGEMAENIVATGIGSDESETAVIPAPGDALFAPTTAASTIVISIAVTITITIIAAVIATVVATIVVPAVVTIVPAIIVPAIIVPAVVPTFVPAFVTTVIPAIVVAVIARAIVPAVVVPVAQIGRAHV